MRTAFPTPYPQLNAVLSEFVAHVQAVLSENFVATYLQGSFAVGGFDQDSDVDFLVVTKDFVSERPLQALQAMHAHIYDLASDWAKHLEGSYIANGWLNRHDVIGVQPLWYLDNGSRSLVRSVHDNTWVVRWVVRERGITLAGPEPGSLIAPVAPTALRGEVLRTMRDWGERLLAEPQQMNNRWYQPFAVLSYCRMLQTLATGTIQSKLSAARWAQGALDRRWSGLIQRAWDERPNPSLKIRQPADPEDFRSTQDFVRYAIEPSRRYAEALPANHTQPTT